MDRPALPRHHFRHLFSPQLFHLGPKIFRRGPLYHYDRNFMHVDGRFSPPCFLRLLFWIPKTAIRGPSANQSNPPTNPRPTLVYEYDGFPFDGRGSTLRSGFHRTFLYLYGYLGKRVLLPLWISLPCLCYSNCSLFADIDCHGLLPVMVTKYNANNS